ncbi:2-oxoacid:acceptor oxidoreductase subunit alpha [Candidatus Roizmanbacteria bacterium]|nr:2-oxoacid:acceptor oxidoreductase subunit alpha [Candidatus Roizmanbacteria bacterium]
MKPFVWKIGGEAGFGIMTTGLAFSKIAAPLGYYVFDYSEYPSLIRGGHNTYEVVVSDKEIATSLQPVDLLICLNKTTFELHRYRLNENSMVIYDPDEFQPDGSYVKLPVSFSQIKKETNAQQVMLNTVAMGATIAILGGNLEEYFVMIEKEFARKGQEVVDYNKKFAQRGYDEIMSKNKDRVISFLVPQNKPANIVMSGNEAFSLGAVIGDCRFYAAYPMTPTSNVLSQLASWAKTTKMVVRHSEDEVAVVNSAIGASHAGARSAVGTSGGGFALMVEAVSLAGITELPLVLFLGMRSGPATGMPTWTEQGDLLFAVNAGHGEFPKIVLAPGDVEEMIELTAKAFDLADIYQEPVIVVSDKLVCESHKSMVRDHLDRFIAQYTPRRGKTVVQATAPYLRYKVTDDGISERLIPGQPGIFYQSNSYEHTEDSHTTESMTERVKQVDKRARKINTYLARDFSLPAVYGDPNALIKLVSWGPNKGAVVAAQELLKEKGITTSYIHFTHIHPLDREKVAQLLSQQGRYILIENNSGAQFGKLILMETGIELKEKYTKYDGRPIYPEEIVTYIEKSI